MTLSGGFRFMNDGIETSARLRPYAQQSTSPQCATFVIRMMRVFLSLSLATLSSSLCSLSLSLSPALSPSASLPVSFAMYIKISMHWNSPLHSEVRVPVPSSQAAFVAHSGGIGYLYTIQALLKNWSLQKSHTSFAPPQAHAPFSQNEHL